MEDLSFVTIPTTLSMARQLAAGFLGVVAISGVILLAIVYTVVLGIALAIRWVIKRKK